MSSPKGWKTLWEKEKLLVMRNFFISHSGFKIFVLQAVKTHLLWKLLTLNLATLSFNDLEEKAF